MIFKVSSNLSHSMNLWFCVRWKQHSSKMTLSCGLPQNPRQCLLPFSWTALQKAAAAPWQLLTGNAASPLLMQWQTGSPTNTFWKKPMPRVRWATFCRPGAAHQPHSAMPWAMDGACCKGIREVRLMHGAQLGKTALVYSWQDPHTMWAELSSLC